MKYAFLYQANRAADVIRRVPFYPRSSRRRAAAARVSAGLPKVEKRKKPSPHLPKPSPGGAYDLYFVQQKVEVILFVQALCRFMQDT